MNLETALDEMIKRICPVHGISFGNINNRKTWRIDFTEEATDEQKNSAMKAMDEFVWDEKKIGAHRKKNRDLQYIGDFLYRKAYIDYRELRTDATFTDFMDYLESIRI